jgi:hypothetical protein
MIVVFVVVVVVVVVIADTYRSLGMAKCDRGGIPGPAVEL